MSTKTRAPLDGVTVALLLAAAVAEIALLGIDSGLERLQIGGSHSYGMTELLSLSGSDPPLHAQTAVATWHTASGAFTNWAGWYVAIDFALVGCYAYALWRIAAHVGVKARWIFVVVGAELVENVAQLILVNADPAGFSAIDNAAAWLGALAWWVRWLVLGGGVIALTLAWLGKRHPHAAGPVDRVRMAATERRGAWAPLRSSVVVIVLAGVVLVLPVSDQVPDILRRWLDRGAAERLDALAAMATVVAFTAAVWLAGQRVNDLKGRPTRGPLAPAAMLGLAAVLLAAGLAWHRLWGLAVVAAAVAGLTLLSGVGFLKSEIPEGWQREFPDPEVVRRRVRWLAAAVPAIVGLACVRAFAPPVFLLSPDVEGGAWSWDIAGLVAGAVLAVAGTIGCHALLERLDRRGRPPVAAGRVLLAAALVVAFVCGWWSDELPRAITTVGVLMVGLTIVTLACAEVVRVVETGVPSKPFLSIGLSRTPAFLLILAWFLVASVIDNGSFHDVRVIGAADHDAPVQRVTTLADAFGTWKAQSDCPEATEDKPLRPLLMVGAAGGGIRAAYWTRTLLADLTARPCARTALFAASGISGGSLGLVSQPPSGGDDDPLAADHVSPTFANLMFVDAPRSLLGFDAADRAERMEKSWERADASLTEPFGTVPPFPLLFLNGTSVTDGCRFSVGQVEIGAEPPPPMRKHATVGPDCRGLDQYGRDTTAAGGAVDLADFLCDGQDVRRSTAALLSARFPVISPSGRLVECAHPGREDARVEYVVDGGYVDHTGAVTMLDVWRAIEPLAAADSCIAPVFVQLENGYVKIASAPGAARPGELTVPLATLKQIRANTTPAVGAEARIAFGQSRYYQFAPTSRPGVQAPLGWVLSGSAQRDLDDQRAQVEGTRAWRTLRDLLDGRVPC